MQVLAAESIIESQSLPKKLRYYTQKYGWVHAICSYLGRYNFALWQILGPIVTRSYIRQYFSQNSTIILNLGGGGNCIKGCLTVDVVSRADAYTDITKPLPFADCSVDDIFCEEAIEHISLQQGESLLKECFRVLKPGGVLRITTPSLNWFAAHVEDSVEFCNQFNDIFYGHDHRYIYTSDALVAYLQKTGFVDISLSFYQDAQSKLGYLDSHADRFSHSPEISQYLESQKPSR
jgi:predicted SAM-dependent methyltransferase